MFSEGLLTVSQRRRADLAAGAGGSFGFWKRGDMEWAALPRGIGEKEKALAGEAAETFPEKGKRRCMQFKSPEGHTRQSRGNKGCAGLPRRYT